METFIQMLKKMWSHTAAWAIVGILIGVIGALLSYMSLMKDQRQYISEIQSKSLELQQQKFELQKLLNDVKTSADYGKRFELVNKKITVLEKHLTDIERIKPYYTSNLKIPDDIAKKRNILEKIKRSKLSKEELYSYATQDSDINISKVALLEISRQKTDEDINVFVELALNDKYEHWPTVQDELIGFINTKNYELFEKAILKYSARDDQLLSYLIRALYKSSQSFMEKSLLRIKMSLNKNDYIMSHREIDSKLISVKKNSR